MIAVDLMGPYPGTAKYKRFILVVTDIFTKWVEAFVIGKATAVVMARLMEEQIFQRFGYPSAIISDYGPHFTSARWKRSCQEWSATPLYTPVYHSRANPAERRNQELNKCLRIRMLGLPENQWAKQLQSILFELRTRQNAATGLSPAEALLGYEMPRPGDHHHRSIAEPQRRHHQNRNERLAGFRAHQRQDVRRYDHPDASAHYQVGDEVMVHAHPQTDKRGHHKAFAAKWLGPYQIRATFAGRVYLVDREGGKSVRVHANDIRPAPGRHPIQTRDSETP